MLTLSAICAAIQAGCTPGELARMRREEWERKQVMSEGELILQLLKDLGLYTYIHNSENGKRLVWRNDIHGMPQWFVYNKGNIGKSTEDLVEAIKWLRGEE